MATEPLVIEVTERGARVVSGSLRDVAKAGKEAEASADTLSKTLKTIATVETARRAIALADAYTNIENRMKAVSATSADASKALDSVFRIAGDNRQSVEQTAQVFQRMTLATRDLGLSQERVAGLTDTLSKALVLSGASAQEGTAALVQLAQGMGAGALRGEELNSILEQAPVIARLLAKEMGVAVGQLKALGQQGAISGEIITRALEHNAQALQDEFAKATPTVMGTFEELKTAVIKFVGEVEKAVGLFRSLAHAIHTAADNLRALLDLDIGELAANVGDFLARVRGLGGAIDHIEKNTKTLSETVLETANAYATLDGLADRITETFDSQMVTVRSLIAAQEDLGNELLKLGKKISGALEKVRDDQRRAGEEARRQLEQLRNGVIALAGSLDPVVAAERELYETRTLLNAATAKGIISTQLATELLGQYKDATDAARNPLEALNAQMENELRLARLSAEQRTVELGVQDRINDARAKGVEITAQLVEQFYAHERALLTWQQANKESEDAAKSLRDELQKGIKAAEDAAKAIEEFAIEKQRRLIESLEEIDRKARDTSTQLGQFLGGAIGSLTDRLVHFAATGKFAFKDFARSLATDIAALMLKILALRAAMAAFGGPTGVAGNPFAQALVGALGGGIGGAATGGSLIVPGSGGPDSRLLMMKVSPGERVDFHTRQQQAKGAKTGTPQAAAAPATHVYNLYDHDELAQRLMTTPSGERAIVNVVARNSGRMGR